MVSGQESGEKRQGSGVRSRESEGAREMVAKSAKDLKVYQKAYALAMEVFLFSKHWPAEEKYSLTDQIRRSSRGRPAGRP